MVRKIICRSISKDGFWCYKNEHIAEVQKNPVLNYPFFTHHGSNFCMVQINQNVGEWKGQARLNLQVVKSQNQYSDFYTENEEF